MRIDIWSDVVCPWCFIGKRRFDRALMRLSETFDNLEERLDIVYRAYQLDPSAPIGTPTPVRDVYARKFGGPERAEAIFQQMTQTAASEDIQFDFLRAVRANTELAHRLLWWTYQQTGYAGQSILKEHLMAAYFTHGRDLGDVDTLIDTASAASEVAMTPFDSDQTREFLVSDSGLEVIRADMREAGDNGITGVPTYVIDGKWSIPGAQDTDTFVRVFQRALERRPAPTE